MLVFLCWFLFSWNVCLLNLLIMVLMLVLGLLLDFEIVVLKIWVVWICCDLFFFYVLVVMLLWLKIL